MLTRKEKEGFREILQSLSEGDLIALKDIVTNQRSAAQNKPEAIQAILTYTDDANQLFNRKKLKRDCIFTYLVRHGVPVSPKADKNKLIRTALNYWGTNVGEIPWNNLSIPPQPNQNRNVGQEDDIVLLAVTGKIWRQEKLHKKEMERQDQIRKQEGMDKQLQLAMTQQQQLRQQARMREQQQRQQAQMQEMGQMRRSREIKHKKDMERQEQERLHKQKIEKQDQLRKQEMEDMERQKRIHKQNMERQDQLRKQEIERLERLHKQNMERQDQLRKQEMERQERLHKQEMERQDQILKQEMDKQLQVAEDARFALQVALQQEPQPGPHLQPALPQPHAYEHGASPQATAQQLAKEFVTWFFKQLNALNSQMAQNGDASEWGPQHFFNDCKLKVNIQSRDSRREEFEGADVVSERFRSLVQSEGLLFNPNVSDDGTKGVNDPYGLVLVYVCGTIHREGLCLGVFEQKFGLVQDPLKDNNWKIKFTELNVKSGSVDQVPALCYE